MNVFLYLFFFFNDTATTEIYTLSLHDALPIYFSAGFALVAVLALVSVRIVNGYRACPAFVFTFGAYFVTRLFGTDFTFWQSGGYGHGELGAF